MKKVIDNVKDINAVDKNGQTALFEAVLKDDLRLALALINIGVNLNIIDKMVKMYCLILFYKV